MPSNPQLAEHIRTNTLRNVSRQELFQFTHTRYNNALLMAAALANSATLQYMCNTLTFQQKKALLNQRDDQGRTALILAVRSGSLSKVQILLQITTLNINEIERRDEDDENEAFSALDYAAFSATHGIFERLVVHQAKFTDQTWSIIFDEHTAIHSYLVPEKFLSAVAHNYRHLVIFFCHYFQECTRRQIDFGHFLTAEDNQQRHALLIAAHKDYINVIKLLLELRFDLKKTDCDNHTLFYYLLAHNHHKTIHTLLATLQDFNAAINHDLQEQFAQTVDFTSVTDRGRIGSYLTRPLGHSRQGYIPIAHSQEITRPPRSYIQQRTRQILRHLSSQIFARISELNAELQEVEAMYLHYNNHDYLFVVGNPIQNFSTQKDRLVTNGNLRIIISRAYVATGAYSTEINNRSARYAKKLRERIYSDTGLPPAVNNVDDLARANIVRNILRSGKTAALDIVHINGQGLAILNSPAYQEAVIVLHSNTVAADTHGRHAEEFLVDVLDALPAVDPHCYSCIGGKKRPCMGCYGRMKDIVNEHGPRPGRFWLHTLQHQSPATAKKTAQALLIEAAHVSTTSDGQKIAMVDSGSDSD